MTSSPPQGSPLCHFQVTDSAGPEGFSRASRNSSVPSSTLWDFVRFLGPLQEFSKISKQHSFSFTILRTYRETRFKKYTNENQTSQICYQKKLIWRINQVSHYQGLPFTSPLNEMHLPLSQAVLDQARAHPPTWPSGLRPPLKAQDWKTWRWAGPGDRWLRKAEICTPDPSLKLSRRVSEQSSSEEEQNQRETASLSFRFWIGNCLLFVDTWAGSGGENHPCCFPSNRYLLFSCPH